MRLWEFLSPVNVIGLGLFGLARSIYTLFLNCAVLSCAVILPVAADTVYVTSLEWPPYSGKEINSLGSSIATARKAFANEGVDLVVDFFPWSRAVKLARSPNSKYLGYLPEYFSEELVKSFYFSEPVGESPLGFVERKGQPVVWQQLSDLREFNIGVVRDYVNTKEFDIMVASGELQVQAVTSDILNLRKVIAGRLKLAVIDRNVMAYWLERDETLLARGGKLQFNARLLENKKLYVCFKRSESGKRYLQLFNRGLEGTLTEKSKSNSQYEEGVEQ